MATRRFELHRTEDVTGVRECDGAGCDRPALSRGMCSSHYARWLKTGDARIDTPIGEAVREERPCSIEGCERPHRGRGWCGMHLKRWQVHGDPMWLPRPSAVERGCMEPACDQPHVGRGYCKVHYSRKYRTRDQKLRSAHRITAAQWDAVFDRQGRMCPVCLRTEPPGKGTWHVHHDHRCCDSDRTCGKCIIAILCSACNIGMGGLGDDPERLERAAALMRTARLDWDALFADARVADWTRLEKLAAKNRGILESRQGEAQGSAA